MDDASSRPAAPTLFQQVLSTENRHNPYPLYEALRETPVTREPDGAYVVSTYKEVSALIRDPRMSADPDNSPAPRGPGISFLNLDPPEHDRLRRMTMRHFGPPNDPDRVERMRGELEAIVRTLIDAVRHQREIDVVSAISYPYPVTVITELLGVPRADEPKFHAWAEAIVQAQDRPPGVAGGLSESAQKAFAELGGYLFGLIEERRGRPRDDMLSRMVNDDGPDGAMNAMELTKTSVLLLLAGHETTVNLISNGMLTLLRKPDLMERLRAAPDLAVPLVEEMLRYEPPVHYTFRATLSDVPVAGVTIPRGSNVVLLLASANRDPARFERPNEFLPERLDNQHLGFGTGIHACFGAPLARLEGQIALREMARRFVAPRLIEDPPPYRHNPTLRGPRSLRIALDGVID